MSVGIGSVGDLRGADRSFGPDRSSSDGWRIVAAAWAVAILLVLLFAAVEGLNARPAVSQRAADYAGVVIPRHDASCATADPVTAAAAPSCPADVESGIERAEASYYGW